MTRRNGTRPNEEMELYDHPATIGYAAETLRVPQVASEQHRPEEKISLFWRVFGGTILSITALVTIQAYQALANNIHELRSDQNRLREVALECQQVGHRELFHHDRLQRDSNFFSGPDSPRELPYWQ